MPSGLELLILGSGDPFGAGGRNQSACLIEAGRRRILLDCGAGCAASLKRLGVGTATVDLVLITHLHADHVAGLPFLYHDYQRATVRETPLRVAGPPGTRRRVESIYRALFPGRRRRRFRVDYRVLQAGRRFRPQGMPGVRVVPFRVRHQVSAANLGYVLEAGGRRIVATGDTGWFEELPGIVRGADLLLCECTHRLQGSPGHLSLEELAEQKPRLTARRVVLTHLGPGIGPGRKADGFELARDGMRIRV